MRACGRIKRKNDRNGLSLDSSACLRQERGQKISAIELFRERFRGGQPIVCFIHQRRIDARVALRMKLRGQSGKLKSIASIDRQAHRLASRLLPLGPAKDFSL